MARLCIPRTTLLVVVCLSSFLPVQVSAKACSGGKRCGTLSVVMHSGTPGQNDCKEVCTAFPFLKPSLKCGGCGNIVFPPTAPAPTAPIPAPTNSAPTAPIPAPTGTNSVPTANIPAPTTAPVPASPAPPILTPTAPIPAPIAPVSAPTASGAYNIYLDLVGIPSSDQAYFTGAKARWEGIITGDLTDRSSSSYSSLGTGCVYPAVIDDLYICASYAYIDGPGNVLGFAGPRNIRNSGLTITGEMTFESVDISLLGGQLGDVILHEMGHVLGIGTLWEYVGVAGPDSANCPYTGAHANAEYQAISGCAVVPTENHGTPGDGTFCGHWDEQCLDNELMTGYLTQGATTLLSRITIGSLEDLGYTVSYSTADSYGTADLGVGCTCRRRRQRSILDMPHGETRQLGVRNPSTKPRRLSYETKQQAFDYGRSILSKRASSKTRSNLNIVDVGNQVVAVVVQDGDGIFSVVVRSP
jgi:Leishmanolysin